VDDDTDEIYKKKSIRARQYIEEVIRDITLHRNIFSWSECTPFSDQGLKIIAMKKSHVHNPPEVFFESGLQQAP
jgi:hypothetical protein